MKKFFKSLIVSIVGILLFVSYASAVANYDTYTPNSGYFSCYSQNNKNYAQVVFSWDSSMMSEFDSGFDTYEQDVVFYNYDGNAYATTASAYQTTLPEGYLDTQLFDRDNEANISVGTTAADTLEPSKQYYVLLELDGQQSNSSMYKINCQEGYHIFTSTYTVFGQSTTTVIPFKQGYVAPESRGWDTEVEGNDSFAQAGVRYTQCWNTGSLSSASDNDYYKIYISTGTKNIRFIRPSSVDYRLNLYDSNQNLLVSYCDNNKDTLYSYNFTSSGYYYFRIMPATLGSAGINEMYYLIIT